MKKLENKVVFITGGNSGIGKASALEAAKEGAIVVVADLPNSHHDETMQELKALGAKTLFVPIDVSDVESVKAAINATVQAFGRLDVALNNAGVGGPYSGIHDMEESTWERIININLTGQFYCVKYELQQFLKQGGGVIVNLSSLAGLVAEPGLVPYTAAKHGVIGMTKNIAVQYGAQNIRANAICPYYIETPLLANIDQSIHKKWTDRTPMHRLGRAEEVAKAFIYFASDDSSYCNGSILALDGGVLAG
ncbi:NAD(P)-dependent dehydrogenase (short-subunit alcohol dehydrogenase family) [Chitinophaga skermanii]|uniref:NAD(P)-dependent dehydrogenase (Short-subunit alcohol dehydrogenase family) n=1 Tax=Chitinophaga skermanii TaxID=331697 RepID=A0A327QQ05_9BACT|nr:glucose 1-dehydrogenase [Chitinophaga skermanii]RAJ06659.1 NAD(P)-dependent dehydrogenase (short-subunit alcohol dehydrogenase family) [Chitinophaga skermanii]